MPEIRPARAEDLPVLAPRLRDADKQELRAATGQDALTGLVDSLEMSDAAWTVEQEAEPFFVFGVAEHPRDPFTGLVWGLGTDDILGRFRMSFLRITPEMWRLAHSGFPWLSGFIDIRNTAHLRWLRWSGCWFGEDYIMGVEKRRFREFGRTADV